MATLLELGTEENAEVAYALDPEALIREARRRQRRRRVGVAAALVVVAGNGIAVWQVAFTHSNATHLAGRLSTPVGLPPTLTLHLVGWGSPVQGYAPSTPCPDGVFSLRIRSSVGNTIGSDSECDLVDSKVNRPDGKVLRTHASLLATYRIADGTIETREQRTFRFSPDQLHTMGRFSGRIISGSGRYAHAGGTISGGGPGGANSASWTVLFHFH